MLRFPLVCRPVFFPRGDRSQCQSIRTTSHTFPCCNPHHNPAKEVSTGLLVLPTEVVRLRTANGSREATAIARFEQISSAVLLPPCYFSPVTSLQKRLSPSKRGQRCSCEDAMAISTNGTCSGVAQKGTCRLVSLSIVYRPGKKCTLSREDRES